MLKYRGQFRVMYELNKSTGKQAEFAFIPCRMGKGSNIYRHNDNSLNVYIQGKQKPNRLLKDYPDIFKPFQMGDNEATLLFKEADIEKAAEILKPRIIGKNLSPRPKRKVDISDERKKVLTDRLRQIHINKFMGEKQGKTV